MDFKHKKLNNGLNIIGEVNKDAQSAAVGFFVRTGARDETDQISGVSHYLEHMLFKGTEKLSALDVNLCFDNLGAQYNAFTSEENTVFYAATLPGQLAEVTNLWCDLLRPSLRDDDFNMEKNVILEEIAMYKDLPQFDVMDRCRALHFDKHPCGKSVLGSEDSVKALTSGQMREYFARRYAPNNITAVVAGNFNFEKICDCLEAGCGKWQPKQADRITEYFAGTSKKERLKRNNLNRQHICLASPTVSYQDKRCYTAMLLAKIIGDDSGSRFFWELVDTAIAETAAMQCEAMDSIGAYYSYIQTSSENGEKVMEIVERIFKSLQKDRISDSELQTAKNKVLSAITIKNEVPMGRLVELGFNWVYLGKYQPIEEEIKRIKDVTIADLYALLDEFPLVPYTQFSLCPEK